MQRVHDDEGEPASKLTRKRKAKAKAKAKAASSTVDGIDDDSFMRGPAAKEEFGLGLPQRDQDRSGRDKVRGA